MKAKPDGYIDYNDEATTITESLSRVAGRDLLWSEAEAFLADLEKRGYFIESVLTGRRFPKKARG